MIRVLFVGDIVGRPGREILAARLAGLREELDLTFVIANGENAAAGAGITEKLAREILATGVDAITLGDHVWDQKSFESEITGLERVCRPANLHLSCPGRTYVILEHEGVRLAVFTVLLQQFIAMKVAECPFRSSMRWLGDLEELADIFVVEAHGEATSEKIALGRFLDGRVSMVVGTHTHVPTADARVLPNGTAYITDAGMTGPYDSVLGREVRPVIERFLYGMPKRYPVASGDVRISAAFATIDPTTKRAVSMELITIRAE